MPFVLALASSIALVLSWLAPGKFLPWVSFQNEALAFVSVALGAGAGLAFALRQHSIKGFSLPRAVVPFFVVALIAVLQRATGALVFWGDLWMLLFYLALCVICLTLGAFAASPAFPRSHPTGVPKLQVAMAATLLVGAIISAVLAQAQVLGVWEDSIWRVRLPVLRRPGANLAQPNHLATLELMGFASLIFLNHLRYLGRLSTGLIFLVLGVGLAATESRTGMLAYFAMTCWWYVKRERIGFKSSPWVVSGAVLSVVLLFWAWPHFLGVFQVTSGSTTGINTSAGQRLVVWPQLLEAAAIKPWLGWGIREIAKAHNAVAHLYDVSDSFTYSHNIILDSILGMGIPLTVLLMLPICIFFGRRLIAANQLSTWYPLAVALPLVLHSLLEFPFSYAYFLVPVMFLIGVMEAEFGVPDLVKLGKRSSATLLALFMLLCGWTGFEYFQAEEDFRMARFENLRIGQTPADYERPELVLLTQLGALRDSIRIRPEPNMTSGDIETVKRVALHYPSGAPISRYALVLALNGEPEEAIRQAQVLRALLGEGAYKRLQLRFEELAENSYPQLREVKLP